MSCARSSSNNDDRPERRPWHFVLWIVLSCAPGLPERRTHDYLRHGTATLFATLDGYRRASERFTVVIAAASSWAF